MLIIGRFQIANSYFAVRGYYFKLGPLLFIHFICRSYYDSEVRFCFARPEMDGSCVELELGAFCLLAKRANVLRLEWGAIIGDH